MAHFLPRTAVVTRSLPNDINLEFLVDVLSRATFLREVPQAKLVELVGHLPVRRYEAGDAILRQGEFGHSLFILVRGSLRISAIDDYGHSTDLARLAAPGQYFGELAMLGRRRRTATVETLEPSILLELEKTRVERLDMVMEGAVSEAIERDTQARSIRTFITNHRFLSNLGEQGVEHLVAHCAQRVYERGRTIFRTRDPADTVLLIKSGTARMVRRNKDGTESVLAYFSTGDVVGLGGEERHGADLVSMGYLEAIVTARDRFLELRQFYPELLERFRKDVADVPKEASGGGLGATGYAFVDEVLHGGVQEGLSVLTINLDKRLTAKAARVALEDLKAESPLEIEFRWSVNHSLTMSSEPSWVMLGGFLYQIAIDRQRKENCRRAAATAVACLVLLDEQQEDPGPEKSARAFEAGYYREEKVSGRLRKAQFAPKPREALGEGNICSAPASPGGDLAKTF